MLWLKLIHASKMGPRIMETYDAQVNLIFLLSWKALW